MPESSDLFLARNNKHVWDALDNLRPITDLCGTDNQPQQPV